MKTKRDCPYCEYECPGPVGLKIFYENSPDVEVRIQCPNCGNVYKRTFPKREILSLKGSKKLCA